MTGRAYRCATCGADAHVDTITGPLPSCCASCDPEWAERVQRRVVAREYAARTRGELQRLRLEVAELREAGGVTASERRRLALASDLLAAYARWGSGRPWPTDDELADALLNALRAGHSVHSRRRLLACAGGCLARALTLAGEGVGEDAREEAAA